MSSTQGGHGLSGPPEKGKWGSKVVRKKGAVSSKKGLYLDENKRIPCLNDVTLVQKVHGKVCYVCAHAIPESAYL